MARRSRERIVLLLGFAIVMAGCRSKGEFRFHPDEDHYQAVALRTEYPEVATDPRADLLFTPPPLTVSDVDDINYWPLTLQEAIHLALANSEVMRDIGGRVLSLPASVESIYDPALTETSPLAGTEAALSAFDARFSTSMFWSKNDRQFNNFLLGGGAFVFQQDAANFRADISKTAATGTQFSLRNVTDYDRNNALLNQFPSVFTTQIEAEVRHPLLQGGGIEFNRIAGPNARPGAYNGVLIARIRTDVSLADFEMAVRNLVRDVEKTYWELYFAYRDLDAKRAGQETALRTWRTIHRKFQAGTADREQEARAREQYYLLRAQAIDALGGTSLQQQKSLQFSRGVLLIERQLRRQMGLPASDGRVIRPAEEPSTAPVEFDWNESLCESLYARVELRRQKWMIKRRELELTAARNFRKMRLDFVGTYRWRGMGDELLGEEHRPNGSAFAELVGGNYQEWQMGLQLSTPIGNRIGHTAIRHAELQLTRERAVLREQELHVSHEVSDAFADLDRTYTISRTNFNRRLAAHQQLEEVRKKYDAGLVPLDFLLDAQRRVVEADGLYYRSLVDYSLAISQVHLARGGLLGYHEVYLSEGPWSKAAHLSAQKQARRFDTRDRLNYCLTRPCPVSAGPYHRAALGQAPVADETLSPRPVGEPGVEQSLPPAPLPPGESAADSERRPPIDVALDEARRLLSR